MPRVSALINVYNGATTIEAAIVSALDQTWRDLEVIVFDNGSRDETPAICRKFSDPRLRYVRQEPTVILAEARNNVMALAEGDYLAYCDADDAWLPTKIEKQVELIEATGTGLVFTDVTLHHVADGSEGTYFKLFPRKPVHTNVFGDQLRQYTIVNSSALFRRSCLQALDRWVDTSLRVCTDFDLFMRIVYMFGADYIDEPLVRYSVASGSTLNSNLGIASTEVDGTISRMIAQWPDLQTQYADDLVTFRSNLDLQRARVLWRDGQISEARRSLLNHWRSPKHLAVYAATLLPYAQVMKLRNAYRRAGRTRHVVKNGR